MNDISQTIEEIGKEIRETPYHKATEHHIGNLRARLSKLKDKELESGKKSGGGGGGYAIKKQGDATVVLIGPPSAGKSTLINKITNADSKVAPYAFTTVSVIPGMLRYKESYIQILDVPGLIEGARSGKGRGKEVLSVARAADLLVLITDIERPGELKRISVELEDAGIRINKTPPQIKMEKKAGGGIIIHSNIRQLVSNATIKEIAQEFGFKNGEIIIKEKLSLSELVDAFSLSRIYLPAIYVVNKSDMGEGKKTEADGFDPLYISASRGEGIREFIETVWSKLNFVRVYLVREDEEPSFLNPIIAKSGQTLRDVAENIGSEFAQTKKSARIWNSGAIFPGQEVSLLTPVAEGMQVRFV